MQENILDHRFKLVILLLVAAVVAFFATNTASAQISATNAAYSSTLQYANPKNVSGQAAIVFYASDGTAHTLSSNIAIGPYQSGRVIVGSASSVPAGFVGSAVLSANIEIAVLGISSDANQEYNPQIYKGFTANDAASTFYLPSVVNNWGQNSRVAIQNIESTATVVDLEFSPVPGFGFSPAKVNVTGVSIPANSSYIFSADDISGINSSWAGSLKITAQNGTSKVIATGIETYDAARDAYAIEGVKSGETTVYVPTSICNHYGGQISYFAVQAIGGAATVDVSHTFTDGANAGETFGETGISIATDGLVAVNPCNNTSNVQYGKTGAGSAQITATSGQIAVVVKVVAPSGFTTGYTAGGPSAGATSAVLPWVQWSPGNVVGTADVYVSIMNVSSTDATNVDITYYNADGTVAATQLDQTINSGKIAVTFWLLASGDTAFDGMIVVTSDQPIIALARPTITVNLDGGSTTQLSEDYITTSFTP